MTIEGTSRSWFCVFNNPEHHGYHGRTPEEVLDSLLHLWTDGSDKRSCALAYCVSGSGTPHVHAVLEDSQPIRFATVRKVFPNMHIEPTKGSKQEAEDYIMKRGRYAERSEEVLCTRVHGEIKSRQGGRSDLDEIDRMLEGGCNPEQIFSESFAYRRYERMVREAYYQKRLEQAPDIKSMTCVWHVGPSGSGKSYCQVELRKKRSSIYLLTDYETGGFDRYSGEEVLFMDEFRGQIKYDRLLAILDVYPMQVHARYANVVSLWNEVHITSVLPPEEAYELMVPNKRGLDSYDQLLRRLSCVVYHERLDDRFESFELKSSGYTNYEDLIAKAHNHWRERTP